MSEINEQLGKAMQALSETKTGKMNFRGKLYSTVALRLEMLRKYLGADVSVVTEIVDRTDADVVMKAAILYAGTVIATGYAEESRGSSNVNKTSALENCETSAVGRALAALGLGGGEYASADELTGAITQQNALEEATEKYADQIKAVKEGIALYIDPTAEGADFYGSTEEDIQGAGLKMAAEALTQIPQDALQVLKVPQSKGGPWTPAEYKVFSNPQFRETYYAAVRGSDD